MKANDLTIKDLMIGDWVYNTHNRQNERVQEIGSGLVMLDYNDLYEYDEIEPIPITPEILEKNGFKKDAFTNLSPDYYFGDDEYSICINLNSTCDKSKSIWIEKRSSRFTVSIEESRHSLDKKPLYVHQLQYALKLCGIKKEIVL